VSLAVAGVGVAIIGVCWTKGPTLWQVERRVRGALPAGTTHEQAEAWLRAERIPFVTVPGATLDGIGQQSVLARAGMAGRVVGRTIRATVEPAFVDLVFHGEVNVYLFFDPGGSLTGYYFVPFADAL
jgi:hypothetical protein